MKSMGQLVAAIREAELIAATGLYQAKREASVPKSAQIAIQALKLLQEKLEGMKD